MKLLRFQAYCFPEQTAGTHLIKDMYEGYAKSGIIAEVYVPTPTRGIDEETRNTYKKIPYEELYDGYLLIHRFALFREGRNPLQRAFRYALCNVVQYFKGVHAKGVDVVFSASTPPTQGVLCGLVKRRLSKKYGRPVPFIYNLQDIFPDSLVTANMTKKGSLLWKIGRKVEDFTYRNADKIIVISEDFKRNIMEKGVPEDKIIIIPNWVNTDNVYAVDRKDNVLFDRYGLDPDKFYVTYSGNIGHSQNMRLLLDAAKELREELPDLRFILMGEGAATGEVAAAIEAEAIDNVRMLPFQPYEDIAHVFSLGDVGLVISKPGIGNSSVPSKTWSILAAQRPVLASFDDDSALSNLIRRVDCGIAVQAGEKEPFKAALRTLYADRETNQAMGDRGRRYLETELNKDKCVGMYVDVILTYGRQNTTE